MSTPMKTPARRRPPGFADPPDTPPPPIEARPPLAVAPVAPERARDPYAGAASRQVNTRLLEPLHTRYMQVVRELEDDGYKTSFTELLHALLDTGPTTADEARELVRAWRRRREP